MQTWEKDLKAHGDPNVHGESYTEDSFGNWLSTPAFFVKSSPRRWSTAPKVTVFANLFQRPALGATSLAGSSA